MNLLEISQAIRKHRQAQGMTLDQLAQKSGFSKGFISQVENFRQTPSLKALVKIAEALSLPLSTLFDDNGQNAPKYLFGNLRDGQEVLRDDNDQYGIKYLSLAYRQIGRKIDPFIVEYTPASPRDFKRHDSEEFFIVLEGKLMCYLYDNTNCHELTAGDTLYMEANIPHRVHLADGCSYAKGLTIYSAATMEEIKDTKTEQTLPQ